ncbi:hypothetical protein ABL78_7174 [Leptomonas seymouri]|uniref:Uncharacterized protein n=1 Tax=Leptomonas seymouri TaxID=5684 RepID=A0A0N1HZY4_LEPSE|nr:hypothetical protein ABL78_7174 [Leptomonas seymouri]|eukprot:KPI83792.1 hypothetical protein ABL78_7174 [Leptomonas seymouri]
MAAVEPTHEDHMTAATKERAVVPPPCEDGVDIPCDDLPAANGTAAVEAARVPCHGDSHEEDFAPPVADGGIDVPREKDDDENPAKTDIILRSPVVALQMQVASRPSANSSTPAATTKHHDHQQRGETATSKSHAVPYEGNGVVHTKRVKKAVKQSACLHSVAVAAEAELKRSAEGVHDTAAAAVEVPAKTKVTVKAKHEDPQRSVNGGAEAASKKKKAKGTAKTPLDGAAAGGPATKVKPSEAPAGEKKTHKKNSTKKATEAVAGGSAMEAVKAKSSPKKKREAEKPKKTPVVVEAETEKKATKKKTKKAPKMAAAEPATAVVEETTTVVMVVEAPAQEHDADEPVPREDHPEAEPAAKAAAEVAEEEGVVVVEEAPAADAPEHLAA